MPTSSRPPHARWACHEDLVQGLVTDDELLDVVDRTVNEGVATDLWLRPWLQAERCLPFLAALPHAQDVEQGVPSMHTLLMQAIMLASPAGMTMVEGLLQAGANVHHISPLGDTPLHLAAYTFSKNFPLIPMLLAHGAKRFAHNRSGQTALLSAVNNASTTMPAEALVHLTTLAHDAPTEVWCQPDAFGQTPFSIALSKGMAVQRTLILAGAGVSLRVGGALSPWSQAERDPRLKNRLLEWLAEAINQEVHTLRASVGDAPSMVSETPPCRRPRL